MLSVEQIKVHLLPRLTAMAAVAFLVLMVSFMYQFYQSSRRKLVGYVAKLYTYPVKSAKCISQKEVDLTTFGFCHDRQFALLNEHGKFVSGRSHPTFTLIKTSIDEDRICVDAEGMPTLKLPLSMKAEDGSHTKDVTIFKRTGSGVHVSEEADNWFSKYFQMPGCQLYCFQTGGTPRLADASRGQVFCEPNYTNEKDTVMFSDVSPVMVLSENSVENLNESFHEEPVTAERFRPNIVVSGSEPFSEDHWSSIEIGNTKLKKLFPCGRCVFVNVDPSTAEKNENVLSTLKRVRPATHEVLKGAPRVGCHYGVRQPGVIKVGDPIYVIT